MAREGMEDPCFHLYVSGMSSHFEILDAHKSYCPPEWKWEHGGNRAETYNLWLVTDGRGSMRTGNTVYELGTGDCFLLRMEEPCHGRHDPEHPLVVPWLVFRVPGQESGGWRPPAVHRRVSRFSFVSDLVEHVVTAHLEPRQQDTSAAEVWLRAALLALDNEDRYAGKTGASAEHTRVIRATCERIRSDPGASWLVEQLAETCHLSPGHFTRLFKAHTGIGPRAFVTRTRMEAARGLLRMSEYTIGEIADLLGYGDIFHFSRQFRQHSGISPSAFREKSGGRG